MKKFNYLFTMLLGSMLLFGVTACDKDEDNHFVIDNQEFVNRASSSNMLEIAAGQLAVNQGSDPAVKAFGNHMIEDHGLTATEMAALATRKNWTIPTALLPEHQQMYDALKGLSGDAFDKQFAATMILSHQKTIELFEQADKSVPDADLRAFASAKLPTLKHHLEEALQLQGTVND